MAKRTVELNDRMGDDIPTPEDTEGMDAPTEEQIAEWEREREEEREKRLAPYRALAKQQSEQDDLLAELLFEMTLKDLEG